MMRTLSPRQSGEDPKTAVHHAKKDHAILAVIFAIVRKINTERIAEGFEAHAVLA
jgi:hypothetical protein